MTYIFGWLNGRKRSTRSGGPSLNHRRRSVFETLEDRRVMTGRGDLFSPVVAILASGATATIQAPTTAPTNSPAAPLSSSSPTQPSPQPTAPATSVNTFDLDLAVRAGLTHLQSILDPTNGNLPYFGVWSLNASQAAKLGDKSINQTVAQFTFDPHFVSNAAGRALYAILAGSEAFGVDVSASVISDLTSTVLKSLTKPRNGNWNDTSAANQMITGLASDPRSAGSQRFDMTYLFNMGAGMRGALALATLSDYAEKLLPGYSWTGESLFEIAVYNLRKFYVYGGGEIGGKRAYDWETFRRQLGLQGGNTYGANVSQEIVPNWSNLLKSFADPFLVKDLVDYYEATGHQGSLELAKELSDLAFNQRFPAAVTDPTAGYAHMFEVVGEMNAYSRLALVTGNVDMMKRVRARYEALRGVGFNSTGWVREFATGSSDTGEINNTVEVIETALNFAQFGWTEYYADAERFTRGQLLPAQILDTKFVTPAARPTGNAQQNFPLRLNGAFGFAAPYGYVATKNPSQTGAFHTDVTAGAVAGLAEIQTAAYSYTGGVHRINLLFDQSNDMITIETPYSGGSKLFITTKVAGDILIRIPAWADSTGIASALIGQNLSFGFDGDYLRIVSPSVGAKISINLPLAAARTTETINGRQITIDWHGDSVVAMSRMGTTMPFFPDVQITGGAVAYPPVAPATPLVANAGQDFSVIVGQRVELSGSASRTGNSDDTAALAVSWSKLFGPGEIAFTNQYAANASAFFSTVGKYTLRLTVKSGSRIVTDDVVVDVMPVAGPQSSSDPVTLVLRDGAPLPDQSSYHGTRDTTISLSNWTTPGAFGASEVVEADGKDMQSALLAWDVSQIPAGSIVLSATIELNVLDWTQNNYEVYALRRAWDELSATWLKPTPTTSWTQRGALNAPDRDSAIAGVISPRAVGRYVVSLTAVGVAAVQAWVNAPESNFGLIVQDYSAPDDLLFSSSEAADSAARPALRITYLPPTAGVAAASATAAHPLSIPFGQTLTLAAFEPDVVPPSQATVQWTLTLGPGPVTFFTPTAAITVVQFSKVGIYTIRSAVTIGDQLSFTELVINVGAPLA